VASGLLSVSDFSKAFEEYCYGHVRPDYILIPLEPFDWRGNDLTGCPYLDLARTTGIETIVM